MPTIRCKCGSTWFDYDQTKCAAGGYVCQECGYAVDVRFIEKAVASRPRANGEYVEIDLRDPADVTLYGHSGLDADGKLKEIGR